MVLPKLTFVLLCSSFHSPLPLRWRFAVAPLRGFMEVFVIAAIPEVFITLSFCLKHSVKFTTLITKYNHALSPFHCDSLIDHRRVHYHEWIPVFSIMERRDTFMLFSVYNAVLRGEHVWVRSLLAYNFLINKYKEKFVILQAIGIIQGW